MCVPGDTFPPRLFCNTTDNTTTCGIHVSYGFRSHRPTRCATGHYVPQVVFKPRGDGDNSPSCGLTITDSMWNRPSCVDVYGVPEGLKDKNKNMDAQLDVTVVTGGVASPVLVSYTVKVKVIDKDKVSVCRSVGDPHITTFDKRTYDVFQEGEFILYRHKTLPYEVRSFFRSCNKKAACNCAVAARIGDDVIVFDRCGASRKKAKKQPLVPKLFLNGQLAPRTTVSSFNNGRKYKIVFPSGGELTVAVNGNRKEFLNIWYRAAADDYLNSEGLCGHYDGDNSNDLMFPSGKLYSRKERRPKDFSKSWRVDEMGIDTIYSGVCTDEVNTVIPPVPVYCDCNLGSAPVCGADLDISSCTKPDKKSRKKKKGLVGEDVTEVMIQQATSPPSHCLSRAALVLFEFNATYISRDFTWPTPTNITEVQAFQKCKTTVEASVAFQGCKNVPDIGFSVSLDSCAIDIQVNTAFSVV
ncbi:uncharacterized protein LOC144618409 [Crassostrea virginica]